MFFYFIQTSQDPPDNVSEAGSDTSAISSMSNFSESSNISKVWHKLVITITVNFNFQIHFTDSVTLCSNLSWVLSISDRVNLWLHDVQKENKKFAECAKK